MGRDLLIADAPTNAADIAPSRLAPDAIPIPLNHVPPHP